MRARKQEVVEGVRDAISGLGIVTSEPTITSAEEIEIAYAEEGFEATDWLIHFLSAYEGLAIEWHYGNHKVTLSTRVDMLLEAPHSIPRNIRIFSNRIGFPSLPAGVIFSDEDTLLLASNGDFLRVCDAGIQWVAHGFEKTARALVTGDWDKTFHPIKSSNNETLARLMTNPQ